MDKTSIHSFVNTVAELTGKKGTCFVGFTYRGTDGTPRRRNVTVGLNLANYAVGGTSWGKTYAGGAIVEHKGELYLQGVENNTGDTRHPKRFKIAKIETPRIG